MFDHLIKILPNRFIDILQKGNYVDLKFAC